MRLHSLELSAFGPFCGTERIDFEELNSAGLFLLTGPTGAGKTSILDAICFALYGWVPGVRGVKTLKSQHAGAEVRPEVVLDFTIGQRRFVLRRSPEWTRPKRRGDGTTEEKACATLIEVVDGEERLLSSRAQEVGHLVGMLVGMSAAQFVQVALLPQGEFQKFLRANSSERHDVLQHLFKTDRFAKIEEWVHDHSRQLDAGSARAQQQVQRVVDALVDRSAPLMEDAPLPEFDGVGDADASARRLLAWAEQILHTAQQEHAAAVEEQRLAALALASARSTAEAASARESAAVRHREADRQLQQLIDTSASAERARGALEEHRRAAECRSVLGLLDSAETQLRVAAAERQDALDLLGAPSTATTAELEKQERQTLSLMTRLETLLPRERQLRAAEAASVEASAELLALRDSEDELLVRIAEIPGQQTALRRDLDAATENLRLHEAIVRDLSEVRTRLLPARQVPAARMRAESARGDARRARDRAADARDRLQDVVERRLAGIAAELAGRLTPGAACQVCGATEHPVPATAAPDAVSEDTHTEAVRAFRAAGAEQERLEALATAEEQTLADLVARSAGRTSSDLEAEEATLVDEEAAGEQALALQQTVNRSLEAFDAELSSAEERLAELRTRRATQAQVLAGHEETIAQATAELRDAMREHQGSLADALASARIQVATLRRGVGACAAADRAEAQLRELEAHVRETSDRHGFASVAAVRKALLTDEIEAAHREFLADRAEREAVARSVLADEHHREALQWSGPSAADAASELDAAQGTERNAVQLMHREAAAAESLLTALDRLRAALEEWVPARERSVRAHAIASLVRGTGGDNQLQMRLSAYVLATRLDQVVAAANERLAHMRDQRYQLERTGRAARRGSQAGLGLQVLDEWTGEVRDPASLSGGETFVVSLCLALGLADVVTQEAGGVDVETLFVDEGFGMLDVDTLDDVMDRLDGLRAGGRTVGVVSHVSELRDRIPTQVHLTKTRTGSTIAVRTLVC